MKQLRLLPIVFVILSGILPAAGKADEKIQKIVVAEFDVFLVKKQYGSIVSDVLVSRLSEYGTLQVIERRKIGAIMDELSLAQSGVVNPDDAVKSGRVAGADRMVVGSVGKLGVEYVVNARIINIETGRVIKGFSLTGSNEEDIPDMTAAMSALIQKVLEGKEAVVPEQYRSKRKASGKPEPAVAAGTIIATGYWQTEWYDGTGKHSGAMFLTQSGKSIKGWTVESIGPAEITATIEANQITGAYTASYGSGKFEFTLTDDGLRLLGSYTASHGTHNTWNGRRIAVQPVAVKNGERVFCDWSKDIWSYPGVITAVEGNRIQISFDDGDTEWTTVSRLHAPVFYEGEVVFVAASEKKEYRYATVIKQEQNRVQVEYADGTVKHEAVKMIRLLRVRKEGY